MRSSGLAIVALVTALAGCRQSGEQQPRASQPKQSPAQAARPIQPKDETRQPRAKIAPAIDPKSNAAAEALVGDLARLLSQRKFAEAYMLIGAGAPPKTQFIAEFARYSDLSVKSGMAGGQEGAAGSIYVSVPLAVSGKLANGKRVERSGSAVLRRVNDVPGSTEAQRRWHIERIDWADTP